VDLQTITECLSDAAEGKGDSEQATVDPAAFADEAINQLYAAIHKASLFSRPSTSASACSDRVLAASSIGTTGAWRRSASRRAASLAPRA
jgi:hypothetical protein